MRTTRPTTWQATAWSRSRRNSADGDGHEPCERRDRRRRERGHLRHLHRGGEREHELVHGRVPERKRPGIRCERIWHLDDHARSGCRPAGRHPLHGHRDRQPDQRRRRRRPAGQPGRQPRVQLHYSGRSAVVQLADERRSSQCHRYRHRRQLQRVRDGDDEAPSPSSARPRAASPSR